MKIDLFMTPGEIPDHATQGRRLVVVDVLRACTSLACALKAGAERIIPVSSVASAKELRGSLDRASTLLAGELEGLKVPGFDLGNSPLEFLDQGLAGKTILFTSTNGAPLMCRHPEAVEKILLSFVNIEAVAAYLRSGEEGEVIVVCAGQGGRFALEDTVCAGMLVDLINGIDPGGQNDGARAAQTLYGRFKQDLDGLLRLSTHGQFLIESGMEDDLSLAARVNSVAVVPLLREGRVTLSSVPVS